MYASSCLRSISVNFTFSHRSLARQSVADTSFKHSASVRNRGITLLRRRSSSKCALDEVRRADRLVMERRQLQVVQARLEVVRKARDGAGQLRPVPLDEPRGALLAGLVVRRVADVR